MLTWKLSVPERFFFVDDGQGVAELAGQARAVEGDARGAGAFSELDGVDAAGVLPVTGFAAGDVDGAVGTDPEAVQRREDAFGA